MLNGVYKRRGENQMRVFDTPLPVDGSSSRATVLEHKKDKLYKNYLPGIRIPYKSYRLIETSNKQQRQIEKD